MPRREANRANLLRWVLVGLAAVVLVVLAVQSVTKSGSEWYGVYVRAASDLWAGRDIYGTHSGFLYPPFPALLATPFLPFGETVTRLIWFAINMVVAVYLVKWSIALAGGRTTGPAGQSPWIRGVAWTLGGLAGLTYFLNALAHQQTDAVIAALLIGGVLAVERGRENAGGTAIGLAIAFKATPLFFIPYLVWLGRYRAAFAAALVTVVVTLLPDLVHRSPNSGLWVLDWLKLYVVPSQTSGNVGSWGSVIIYNQSLAGLIQRALNLDVSFDGTYSAQIVLDPRIGRDASRLLLIAVFGVIVAISWWASRTANRRMSLGDVEKPALTAGLILILMLLASPMSSVAHFVTLVLPGLALAHVAIRTGDRRIWGILIVAGLLALIPNKDLAGRWLYAHALWNGVVTWNTLLLWFGSVFALMAPATSAASAAIVPAEDKPAVAAAK